MKKILFFFLVCFVSLTFVINAFSMNIDGIDSGTEWHDSFVNVFFEGESNSNINLGLVKVKFDNENSAVYLCFRFIDPLLEQGNELCGLRLSLNGSSCFELDPLNSPVNADIDKYNFDGAIYIDENNGATCEIRIGFKEKLPQMISCDVQLIDSFGEPSNHYYIDLVNEGYSETSQIVIAPTSDNDDPNYNSGLLTEKTTKQKTTVLKTTKENTEKSTTRKKYSTSKPAPTTVFVISEPPMIYTGRTKPPKTTTEEYITKINNGVTVYYYEKEVLISMVPVTVFLNDKRETSSVTVSDITDETTATNYNYPINSNEPKASVSLSDGAKYKKVSIIIGALAFAIIAVCGAAYFKKK